MQGLLSLALALWTLVATVSAHGIMRSPTPRIPGATLRKVCGDGIANLQSTDLNRAGHIQGLVMYNKEIKDHNACNIWLCKGYQFDDNKSNVRSYSGGEVVPIRVELIAPHTGYANVSIVNTASNSVIGRPLISWPEYAVAGTGSIKPSDENFKVTIPSDLTGCTTPGECVIQWYWYSTKDDQSYESCIDFTIGNNPDPVRESPTPTTPTPTCTGRRCRQHPRRTYTP